MPYIITRKSLRAFGASNGKTIMCMRQHWFSESNNEWSWASASGVTSRPWVFRRRIDAEEMLQKVAKKETRFKHRIEKLPDTELFALTDNLPRLL